MIKNELITYQKFSALILLYPYTTVRSSCLSKHTVKQATNTELSSTSNIGKKTNLLTLQ